MTVLETIYDKSLSKLLVQEEERLAKLKELGAPDIIIRKIAGRIEGIKSKTLKLAGMKKYASVLAEDCYTYSWDKVKVYNHGKVDALILTTASGRYAFTTANLAITAA